VKKAALAIAIFALVGLSACSHSLTHKQTAHLLTKYLNGDVTALAQLQKFARRGDVEAEVDLGHIYRNGRGVPINDAKSAYWYRKAARRGNTGAEVDLAGDYANGQGEHKNLTKAVHWLRKAAEQGGKDGAIARWYLGLMQKHR